LLDRPEPVPAGDVFPLQAMLEQTLALYEELAPVPRRSDE
jgi:hypothetical protein